MCERELKTEQNCNILTPTLLAITAFLFRSPGLLNQGPGGPASLSAGFSTASYLPHLISNSSDPQLLNRGPEGSLAGCWLSLPHLVSNSADPQTLSQGQFTGHSLPVDQFETVPRDFNPVPYCQPSSPTPMEYALPPSLEWHVWPGRRSIYYTYTKLN